jgi:hypothetical protein
MNILNEIEKVHSYNVELYIGTLKKLVPKIEKRKVCYLAKYLLSNMQML